MDEDSKKIAQETFDKLPQDIKEVIFADDYQKILVDIGKKFNLTQEQSSKLEFETTMVLMGVDQRSYFQFNLESELGLDEDTAQSISKEIADTVFAEVWEQLDTMDASRVGDDETLNKKLDYEEKKEEENPENDSTVEKTGTSNIAPASLTTLADRLKQASIAAPAKRDYSLNQKPGGVSGTETPGHTIDPYHESIDNE